MLALELHIQLQSVVSVHDELDWYILILTCTRILHLPFSTSGLSADCNVALWIYSVPRAMR